MSDLIDRQAAIDAAIEATDSWEGFCSIGQQKLIENYINSLPFAPGIDCISRRAAIDICANVIDLFRGQFGAGVLVAIKESIEKLPSALGANLAEVGTDCISRQAAINAIDECYCGGEDSCGEPWIYQENAVEAIQMIEPILPAEPQIIRCKDCKHWIPYDWMFSEVWQSKNMADYPEDEIGCDCCDMAMKANDFCSRAERRTE